jgi:hypothetical protein
LSDCSLARCKLIRISMTLSDMSDTCPFLSFLSNSTSLCYVNYEDDIDDFVVKA